MRRPSLLTRPQPSVMAQCDQCVNAPVPAKAGGSGDYAWVAHRYEMVLTRLTRPW